MLAEPVLVELDVIGPVFVAVAILVIVEEPKGDKDEVAVAPIVLPVKLATIDDDTDPVFDVVD